MGSVHTLHVGTSKKTLALHYVSSLRDIPEGKLGIYKNVSDGDTSGAGYVELVRKLHDPNHADETAATRLAKSSPQWQHEEIGIL